MNKPIYLGFSILELSNIIMHELLYDYVKPKYGEKSKLRYMNTDTDMGTFSLYTLKQIMFIKTLQKMLKQGLILQIMNQIDHYIKEKRKK